MKVYEGRLTVEVRRRAGAACEAVLAAVDRGAAPKEAADLVGYVAQLERERDDLELLYQATVETSTSIENDLSRKNDAVTRFLATMSHELRTPLNAVLGHTEMIAEALADDGDKRFDPDLAAVKTAARLLLELISDILDLSKVEAGSMKFVPEPVDLLLLAGDVAGTVEPLAARNGNRLVLDVPDGLPPAWADPMRVTQVLMNLLSNATKFTERGTITIRGSSTGGMVALAVSDTGIGMTEEHLGRLFRPFEQASADTTRKYGGTGLGLALSRAMCNRMGGDLSASSRPGAGSTFVLTLPIDRAGADPGDERP